MCYATFDEMCFPAFVRASDIFLNNRYLVVQVIFSHLQTFLSELYVYLIDQMHESLSRTLALEDQAPIPAPLTDSAQLKHFAREAEVNGNIELATKYYQEVRVLIWNN